MFLKSLLSLSPIWSWRYQNFRLHMGSKGSTLRPPWSHGKRFPLNCIFPAPELRPFIFVVTVIQLQSSTLPFHLYSYNKMAIPLQQSYKVLDVFYYKWQHFIDYSFYLMFFFVLFPISVYFLSKDTTILWLLMINVLFRVTPHTDIITFGVKGSYSLREQVKKHWPWEILCGSSPDILTLQLCFQSQLFSLHLIVIHSQPNRAKSPANALNK